MRKLKVLSVGLSELTALVRDSLMLRAHSKVAVVSNYWGLCSMSLRREGFQVAVLNEPNSALGPADLLAVIDQPNHGVAAESTAQGSVLGSMQLGDVVTYEAKMAGKVLLWCLLLALALLIFCTQEPL